MFNRVEATENLVHPLDDRCRFTTPCRRIGSSGIGQQESSSKRQYEYPACHLVLLRAVVIKHIIRAEPMLRASGRTSSRRRTVTKTRPRGGTIAYARLPANRVYRRGRRYSASILNFSNDSVSVSGPGRVVSQPVVRSSSCEPSFTFLTRRNRLLFQVVDRSVDRTGGGEIAARTLVRGRDAVSERQAETPTGGAVSDNGTGDEGAAAEKASGSSLTLAADNGSICPLEYASGWHSVSLAPLADLLALLSDSCRVRTMEPTWPLLHPPSQPSFSRRAHRL